MELIDVLDKKGNKTGEVKSKNEIHEKGLWHRAVHMWILNSKGELLLQKRSSKVNSYPNCWDISAAGHLSAGDNSVDAAVREIKEELGLVIDPSQLEFIGEATQSVVINNNTYFNNEFNDVYLVKLDLNINNIKLQDAEVSEIKFILWQELQKWIKEGGKGLVPHPEEEKLLFETLEKL